MSNPVDQNETTPNETWWPGVESAYDFVLPSYQLLTSRFEAADTRLTALLTFAFNLTLGGPLFAKAVSQTISFKAPVFWIAMASATVAVVCGVIGRRHGRIVLPNPGILFDKALRESPWLSKKNAIFFAGKHFETNSAAIEAKGKFADALAIALLVEVWMFIVWIAL